MLSALIEPSMYILKKHIALSGMIMENAKVIESPEMDLEKEVSKITAGPNSLGIVYSRGRLDKTTRHVDFHFVDTEGKSVVRKGFNCSVPLSISIITNQLNSLDYLEIIHRMHLSLESFEFNLILPSIEEQVSKIPYALFYSDVAEKSGIPLSGNLKDGFRYYSFSISLNGFLLAPYVETANLVTAVDFKLIPYNGDIAKVGEINENNSVSIYIPKD